MTIEWKATEQNVQMELVSKDHRWHITKTVKGHATPEFSMSNYDLLYCPHGTGETYEECFVTFIKECDEFINRIKKGRDEAEQHLKEITKNQGDR